MSAVNELGTIVTIREECNTIGDDLNDLQYRAGNAGDQECAKQIYFALRFLDLLREKLEIVQRMTTDRMMKEAQ